MHGGLQWHAYPVTPPPMTHPGYYLFLLLWVPAPSFNPSFKLNHHTISTQQVHHRGGCEQQNIGRKW